MTRREIAVAFIIVALVLLGASALGAWMGLWMTSLGAAPMTPCATLTAAVAGDRGTRRGPMARSSP